MNPAYRKISIILELERSIKFLQLGINEIDNISFSNDFYDPVFLYLSSGLERLFKVMLCLNFKERHKRLPTNNEIWNNKQGHNLEWLKKEVDKICIPIKNSLAKDDYEIITEAFSNDLCKILGLYGSGGRYFNLDAILGKNQDFDCKKEWGQLERMIGISLYGEQEYHDLILTPNRYSEIYESINNKIRMKLEKLFRAVTRQFIFGNFSSESNTFIFQIQPFSQIKDSQLGRTEY